MTTPAAEKLYEAQHNLLMEGKRNAIHNPNNLPIDDLPKIFGFNNGGSSGFMHAQLITEDGFAIGSHMCSSESYMLHDLGILEGTREDRHKTFRKHYPNGYKMEFIPHENAKSHKGLIKACELNQERAKQG